MLTTAITVLSAEVVLRWDQPEYACTLLGTVTESQDLFITEVSTSLKVHADTELGRLLDSGDLVYAMGSLGGAEPRLHSLNFTMLPSYVQDLINRERFRTEARLASMLHPMPI